MIYRLLFSQLKQNIVNHKVILLTGPRRTGKRTAVRHVLSDSQLTSIEFDATLKSVKQNFKEQDLPTIRSLIGKNQCVVIHEAQYIEGLQNLIEFVLSDELAITLILCCSYDPLLDHVLREVLQLQGLEMTLLPSTFYELSQKNTLPTEDSLLEKRLIFGNYPEVTEDLDHAEIKLREMIQEVIFTNLGVTNRINKGDKLLRMLQIISFNIGEPISYHEIGEQCGLDNETVERYVNLLERSYVLIKLPSFYNQHRYELKKSHVFYFLDNGIRNALINNFNPVVLRNDIDQLWRNWIIAERIKWNKLNGKNVSYYFWRTHTRQNMDLIEVTPEQSFAYKTSWTKKKKPKFPSSFLENYPNISTRTLNRSTYWTFLSKK